MFGHKHEWHQVSNRNYQEDRPHGKQGFVRTIYFNIEQCCKCGEQRKALYNEWIHKPENDPDPKSQWTCNHAVIGVLGGLGYEKLSSSNDSTSTPSSANQNKNE
jgi:hypothetical protein